MAQAHQAEEPQAHQAEESRMVQARQAEEPRMAQAHQAEDSCMAQARQVVQVVPSDRDLASGAVEGLYLVQVAVH